METMNFANFATGASRNDNGSSWACLTLGPTVPSNFKRLLAIRA